MNMSDERLLYRNNIWANKFDKDVFYDMIDINKCTVHIHANQVKYIISGF